MTNTTDRRYRPLVYICSPYSGDTETNIKKARDFCRYALDHGQIPLAPHLMFPQFMKDNDPVERELAIFMDIVLMGKCSEVWVLKERISEGMELEIANYLDSVSNAHLSDDTKGKIRAMLREISELESIGDACFNMARTINRKYAAKEDHFIEKQWSIGSKTPAAIQESMNCGVR